MTNTLPPQPPRRFNLGLGIGIGAGLLIAFLGGLGLQTLFRSAPLQSDRPLALPLQKQPTAPEPRDTLPNPTSLANTVAPSSLTRPAEADLAASVTLSVEFPDLAPWTVRGLVVEVQSPGSLVLIPTSVLTPLRTRINGRTVTQVPKIVYQPNPDARMSAPPMMGAYPQPTPVRKLQGLGLTVLRIASDVRPLRILGDVPEVHQGEKLAAYPTSAPDPHSGPQQITLEVLEIDVSVKMSQEESLTNLLRLPEFSGEPGTVLFNQRGQAVAQIVIGSMPKGDARFGYAVPLNVVFQEYYRNEQSTDAAAAGALLEKSEAKPQTAAELPADALAPEVIADVVLKTYEAAGHPPDAASAIRSLFGHIARVGVDTDNHSILVLASAEVHERIGKVIDDMNLRARARYAQAQDAERQRQSETEHQAEIARQQVQKEMHEQAAREAEDHEAHRTEPRRTRIVSVGDRDPHTVARLLTELFGEKADVAVDAPTRSVLITVNRAQTWSEVQFLLAEIEATLTRVLKLPAATPVAAETVSVPPPSAEEATIEQSSQDISRRFQTAPADKKAALRRELEQLARQQFDLRQRFRRRELQEMGSRLDAQRARLDRRELRKSEIIENRVRELLRSTPEPSETRKVEEPSPQLPLSANPPQSSPDVSSLLKLPQPPNSEPASDAPNLEKSYDGISYSQWRRLLSTERKAEKLAAAMDACCRLGTVPDQPQIAADIFRAAAEFESGPPPERRLVDSMGWRSLHRLAPDAVTDQCVIALRNPVLRGRNEFALQLLATEATGELRKALESRHQQILPALRDLTQTHPEQLDWTLAAACRTWAPSKAELTQWPELRSLIDRLLDSGTAVLPEGIGSVTMTVSAEWRSVARTLVDFAPDYPDLAVRLMTRHPQDVDVVEWIALLGPRAEPAVPKLVDEFLKRWNRQEEIWRGDWRHDFDDSSYKYLMQVLKTLGKIGAGADGYELLQELARMSPVSRQTRIGSLCQAAERSFQNYSPPSIQLASPLLRDYSRIHGLWRVESPSRDFTNRPLWTLGQSWTWIQSGNWGQPQKWTAPWHDNTLSAAEERSVAPTPLDPAAIVQKIRIENQQATYLMDGVSRSVVELGTFQLTRNLILDPDSTPRRIQFQRTDGDTAKCIYELTDDTFRILLYTGDQAPERIDRRHDPSGHLLLELKREVPSQDDR